MTNQTTAPVSDKGLPSYEDCKQMALNIYGSDPHGVLALKMWTIAHSARIEKERESQIKFVSDFRKNALSHFNFDPTVVKAYIKHESYKKPEKEWTIEEDAYFTYKGHPGTQFSGTLLQDILTMSADEGFSMVL